MEKVRERDGQRGRWQDCITDLDEVADLLDDIQSPGDDDDERYHAPMQHVDQHNGQREAPHAVDEGR